MGKVARFFQLPGLERRLFLEAVFWCGAARFAILVVPFRKYAWLLGKPQGELKGMEEANNRNETGESLPGEGKEDSKKDGLKQIARAVGRASRHVPWKTRCLVKAIAAKRMLRHRKIECTVYLGVARENGRMIAHAWLKSGNIILTGEKAKKNYTVVSLFK